ncbi:UDP-N-acetylglucosamine 1-carboxyvinyltransferase [Caldicellulosiruptor changbaiensis]|uniref:UDP-N-acetylglucosamine 1-carboxyvinyltransferase n=1 Tax=Caldicellulosiruptor changbaiensis TaxID=1222016 RepID=A0A3T0D2N7_9FIRM|nr:UDP-N-acetylglucosamine 1-carboxyvinyltransferase [Caldicellulosiruptor changbaiensis]AZT89532.1 UDP-N-acetylglucosamine 1-carboxyvinyltransferase [Caldicellulosiruptor changbaiensis]
MEKFIISGGKKLIGSVKVHSSKNAILPILAASILAEDNIYLHDIPMLEDIKIMIEILRHCGCEVKNTDETLVVKPNVVNNDINIDMVNKLRASVLLLGSMLARYNKVILGMPGGCNIGTRPIDLHIKGLSKLGAEIKLNQGYIEAKVKKLKGEKIYLDFPSVGATENIMIAAVLAEGETIIENAATEPEVVCLANFLSSMGAKIYGAGTDTIRILGVDKLKSASFTPIPDRIEAGTYMVMAAVCGTEVEITNVVIEHIRSIIAKFKECNIKVVEGENAVRVISTDRIMPTDIKTLPYPGFPTDMQAPMMSMLTIAKGTSTVVETIFENRFLHVGELLKMGANIKLEGRVAVVEGVKKLSSAKLEAKDLRGGAALVIAALMADGVSEIEGVQHIDRGYFELDRNVLRLGGDIKRIV